ncbi:hypothetical protein C1S99_26485 [Vibrio parahaemolyticus]|nr:hypothetical protein C1T12_26475 [Vibrio parahaemolyticus]PMS57111.1 hypothetical protein C1S91_26505 [Vibrio parahaemolyticus]PMS65123.1 hypothetical protein C1S96_26625 [Vibrio parahaemolyticus]PMS70322.1 hypothetical protein C1T10_26630 [Vibrio parahaemolyticus]PMS72689.1 hypothetical protein C1S88_26595 [Vibrio parahaemolyticus]
MAALMLIKWGHVLDSPQVTYLTLMCMKTACQLKSYDRGFVFSGVKVKAKQLRSQMDLLKIRPIPTRKAHQMVSLSCSYQYFDLYLRLNKT